MGDVRNCKNCGKMFTFVVRNICNECINRELDDFKKVKEYLYDHRGASMTEVAMELGISTKKLTRYLREGRIEISTANGSNVFLDCESCGKSIRSGRYCEECEAELKTNIKGVAANVKAEVEAEQQKKAKTGGMRYLNKNERK